MPFVAPLRRPPPDPVSKLPAELVRPSPYSFIAHANSTSRQHFFGHAKAQRKPEIKPHGGADDFGRKPMTAIKGGADSRHGPLLPAFGCKSVNVTVPLARWCRAIRPEQEPNAYGKNGTPCKASH